MILGKSLWPKYSLTIGSVHVKESDYAELVGITVGKHVSFKQYIANLCWNANCKLHALKCVRKYLVVETAKLLSNAFIDNQFNYALLMWMFCGKTLYPKIKKLSHQLFRIFPQSNSFHHYLLECNEVPLFTKVIYSFF